MRVDHYEKGKLIETISHGGISGIMTGQPQIKLIWSQVNANNSEEIWTISVDGAKYTQQMTLSDKIMGMSWGQVEVIHTVNPGENVMLAAIVGTKNGVLPGVTFDPEEGDIDFLEQYDVAYVLTVIIQQI